MNRLELAKNNFLHFHGRPKVIIDAVNIFPYLGQNKSIDIQYNTGYIKLKYRIKENPFSNDSVGLEKGCSEEGGSRHFQTRITNLIKLNKEFI